MPSSGTYYSICLDLDDGPDNLQVLHRMMIAGGPGSCQHPDG